MNDTDQKQQAALQAEVAKLQGEMQQFTLRQLFGMCAELRVENAALRQRLAEHDQGKATPSSSSS